MEETIIEYLSEAIAITITIIIYYLLNSIYQSYRKYRFQHLIEQKEKGEVKKSDFRKLLDEQMEQAKNEQKRLRKEREEKRL